MKKKIEKSCGATVQITQEQFEKFQWLKRDLSLSEKTLEDVTLKYEELKKENNIQKGIIDIGSKNREKLVEEITKLKAENKDLKRQCESRKGLITVGGKQQMRLLEENERLQKEYFEIAKSLDNEYLRTTKLATKLTNIEKQLSIFWSSEDSEESFEAIRKIEEIIKE